MLKETEVKLQRLRALMISSGYDAIYIKRQDNFAWLTCGGRNYVGPGETGNCGLLITMTQNYAITNNIEYPRMIEEEELDKKGFQVLYGYWHDNGFEKKTIEEKVPSLKVGYDTSNAANQIKLLRFDLTEWEVQRYRQIGEDASLGLESAAFQIQKGQSEYEACSIITRAMVEKGFEILSVFAAADDRITKFRHAIPTSKIINRRVQLGGNFRRSGLVVCLTRYLYFYKPEESLIKQYRDNQTIDCTMMHYSKPGVPFTSVLDKAIETYERLGYKDEYNKHHQGGPIGYQGRDYRVDFNTPGVIAGHQAFCYNPSITGTKSEDTVIATEKGIIPITKPMLFPKVEITIEDQTFIRADLLIRD